MREVVTWRGIFLASALFLIMDASAFAQEKFPTRPITITDPWAPGAGSGIHTQTLQSYFEKAIGVGMVIVHKPGGGGTIAWNYVANSLPDGYTVGIVNPSLLCTRYTTKSGVSYDRFDPLILSITMPSGVVVKADAPWKTFKEFIDYARANPEKVQMANSGHAAMYHLGIMGIEMATGVKFTHVPYKGTAPSITALLGGHVDGTMGNIFTLYPYIQAKQLRILAVSSPKRNPSLPDTPTFREYGFDLEVDAWYAYAAARGTPKERLKILHDAFKAALDSEEFKSFYKKQACVIEYKGPEALTAFLKEQDNLWKKIIDFSGFKPID